jgi:TPR repeat protein
MWEIFEWPPRTPRPAWIFVGAVFVFCLLGLGLAFFRPAVPLVDEARSQEVYAYDSGSGLATSLIEKLAVSGDRVAQLELGERYMAGVGITKDVWQALRWMQTSSDNGYARAHRRFAMFYDDFLGAEASIVISCAYHLRAARVGEPESQYLVGVRYREGVGFDRDPIEAYAWLSLASVSHLPAYRAKVEMEQGPGRKLIADELERARARLLALRKEIAGLGRKKP